MRVVGSNLTDLFLHTLRSAVMACLALWLVVAVPGCTARGSGGVTVADSAGVRITLSADTSRTFATVDTPAVLSLGGPDASGPTQFRNIRGVRVDPRGNIWVADAQSDEIRIFHPDGSFWKSVGGRGEGPGEFMSVRLLGAFRGDSVAVWDDAQGRMTVLDPEGAVARIVTAHTGEEYPPNAFRVFSDGTVLARIRPVLPAGTLEPGSIIPDTAIFARVDYSDMHIVPEGGAPAPKWLWTGHSQIPIPFTVNPGFDLSGDEVLATSGPFFRIRVFRGGSLVESYGFERDPAPVTAREEQEYIDMFGQGASDSPRRQEYLSVLRNPHVPRVLPAYRSLVVADDGSVWVERYEYGSFDVYGSDRVFLGRIEVPVQLTQVVDSRLVGVWRDAMNVEYVRIYRYRK
ncbi:MAG: hypothetical protein LJF04_13265 [Gemmatimonadetes bacterium]|nr:hypothetical protein [Gemmatimonadota bacterium]